MPGGFPMGFEICGVQDVGTVTGSTDGTTITAAGTTNTKGSWSQLVAATTTDIVYAMIELTSTQGASRQFLVDIGVGGSGSEQPICTNLFLNVRSSGRYYVKYPVPLSIPAASRVSARCQCSAANLTCTAKITGWDGAFPSLEGAAGVDMVGISTSSSAGTSITPSASANAKGLFSSGQLIASTARDYMGFVPHISGGTTADIYLVDFGIGGSGSEQVILSNLHAPGDSAPQLCTYGFFPIPIPAGSRLSARNQASAASGAAQTIALACVYA